MTPLAALIAETASMFQGIEQAEQRIRRRGEPMPTTTGAPWRQLAACKRELTYFEGCEALVRELAEGEGYSAAELAARWNALKEAKEGSKADVAVTG